MIAFRHFTKRFDTRVAVDDLVLEVRAGEAVALLGPNGSGKTTTLKAAAGLIRPSAGEVLVGDPPRIAWEPAARAGLSFLPQRVAFAESMTGREVVEFYRRLRGVSAGRTDAALQMAALNGASRRAVGTYSGGMVQRLGLAVALMPASPLLLLDEPTAALDPDGLRAFYAVVDHRKAAGQTVLFTSHQLGDAERLADRFAILVDGRLAALLTARELAERLAARGTLRLRVANAPADLLARLRPLAAESSCVGDLVTVRGPSSARPAVIDCIRASGAAILDLAADEGRLDMYYEDLLRGRG